MNKLMPVKSRSEEILRPTMATTEKKEEEEANDGESFLDSSVADSGAKRLIGGPSTVNRTMSAL